MRPKVLAHAFAFALLAVGGAADAVVLEDGDSVSLATAPRIDTATEGFSFSGTLSYEIRSVDLLDDLRHRYTPAAMYLDQYITPGTTNEYALTGRAEGGKFYPWEGRTSRARRHLGLAKRPDLG